MTTLAPPVEKNLLEEYLSRIDPEQIAQTKWRQQQTILDPMMFALIYLPHHLKNDQGVITISAVHVDWAEQALKFIATSAAVKHLPTAVESGPTGSSRDAYIAPRAMGKSTWWFLIIPLWAAAHGHKKFAAAFADSGGQAETHLTTFKNELDSNALLRADFPNLCAPARRENSGQTIADSRAMIVQKSGFVFAARGIDAANLGLKMNENRPDLIIFDDVEPDEANYSVYQAGKRLGTIVEAILPMNLVAHVIFVGTVTMAGGITHQLVNSVESNLAPEPWIEEQGVSVHYYRPILTDEDGTERSIWPEKWSLEYLKSIRKTRTYAKNFRNLPVSNSGDFWKEEDFVICPEPDGITTTILSIDPAVTTKKSSDFTAIANLALVPGYKPKSRTGLVRPPKVIVQNVIQVKLTGEKLRRAVLKEIENSPTPVKELLVEVNQGGEIWYSVFHNMPIPIRVVNQKIKKEVRAANLLGHYQRGHVQHLRHFLECEEQMTNYPDVLHDDMIDAIGSGVRYFAKKRRRNRTPGAVNRRYV